MFNIITRRTLLEYCSMYPEAATALQQWYYELLKSDSKNLNQLKLKYCSASMKYCSASITGDNRVVFNIMGNKYRLVIRIVFEFKAVQIKWFGTHGEYDKIDVGKILFKKK